MCHDPGRAHDSMKAGTLALLTLAMLGCGGTGDEHASEPVITAEDLEIGKALYDDWDCGVCHGVAGEGTDLGPALSDLEANWKLDELMEYISEPERFVAKDPRLEKLKTIYSDMAMPAFDAIPPEGRRTLAAYVLSL